MVPAVTHLGEHRLLKHEGKEVRLVAHCLSELLRVTTLKAPLMDDKMREVLHVIIESSCGLRDIRGTSFNKRARALELMAKVKSCIIMLDLDCDDLILQMFHHFLDTISETNEIAIQDHIKDIMITIINESDEIFQLIMSLLVVVLKQQ